MHFIKKNQEKTLKNKMKPLKEFINEKKEFIVNVPKDINITGTKKYKELIEMFDDEFSIDKLFAGLTNKTFDYIYWNGNSRGYRDESDAIYSLFPSDSTYYDYIDGAEIYEETETEGVLLRFKTKDNKHVCVIDGGETGYTYVCIEK